MSITICKSPTLHCVTYKHCLLKWKNPIKNKCTVFSTFNSNMSKARDYEITPVAQICMKIRDPYWDVNNLLISLSSHEIWMLCVTVHSSLLLRINFWQICPFGSAAGYQHRTIWVGRANAIYSPAHESYIIACHNTKSQLHLDTWNHYVIHFTRVLKATREMSKQVAQIYHYQ